MAQLHLALLGNPEIRHGQRPLSFRTRKGLALLIYLAVEAGMHTRAHLAALFWPESDASSGRANLRSTLMYLRKTVAHDDETEPQHLLVERDALGFNRHAPYALDLDVVKRALNDQSSLPHLQQAVAVVRSEFLAGFSLPDAVEFDDWLTQQRESWHLRLNDCFHHLSQRQVDGGQLAAAAHTLQQWLTVNPLAERAYRRLMRVQYQQGDRSGALQTFARCRDLLHDELDVDPAPETAVLAKRIRKGGKVTGWQGDKVTRAAPDHPVTPSPPHLNIPLVGRAAEHRTLAAAWRQAQAGQTRLVIIEGEAGIGKTRLARDFLAWAEARGANALAGRAYETGGRLPYQPLVDALRSAWRQHGKFTQNETEQKTKTEDRQSPPFTPSPEHLVTLSPTWLAELSRLLPQLRDHYPDLPPPLDEAQASSTRLFEAVVQLGMALAARRPLLLLIDDVQWADTASLDLLLYALRRWAEEETPLLLLLTLRSEALSQVGQHAESLRQWLSSVQHGVDSTRLQLEALDAGAVAQMAAALAPADHRDSFSRWLYAETEGQPFYVMAMLEALLEEGVVTPVQDAEGAWQLDLSALQAQEEARRPFIPPGVRDLIHHRLSHLTPDAFTLLAAAAVLGQTFGFRLLCRVAGLREVDGLTALEQCTGAHLLQSQTAGSRTAVYRFSHDKIRDVVYTEAGDARRQLFHERAFTALQEADAAPARLAHHALAAGLAQPAFTMHLAAGDAAMDLFAVREAIQFYQQARQIMQEEAAVTPTPTQFHRLHRRLGRAYELVNRWSAADEVYQSLLRYARAEAQPNLEVTALVRRAEVALRGKWQPAQAVSYLQAARAIAEAQQDKSGLVKITGTLSQVISYQFDRETAVGHAEEALALARQLGDEALIARSLNFLTYARFGLPGTLPQVEAEAAEARALFAKLGNRALEADSLVMVAHAQTHRGRPQRAVANLRQAQAIVREIENSWGQVNVAFHLAFALVEVDRLDEALATIEEGLAVAQRHGHDVLLANVYSVRGTVRRARGELAQARADHAEAQKRFADSPFPLLPAITAVHLCADCALAGEWDAAYDYARQSLAVKDLTWLWVWSDTGFFYHHVVAALQRGGDEAAARDALARLETAVGDNPRYQTIYRQAQAALA